MNKNAAVREMVDNRFQHIPANLIYNESTYDRFSFIGISDDAEECDDEGLALVSEPMWGYWFLVDDMWIEEQINENRKAVCDLGFTIIDDNEDGYLLLGIDGAGYDFFEAHWEPLYDFLGFEWHEEETAA